MNVKFSKCWMGVENGVEKLYRFQMSKQNHFSFRQKMQVTVIDHSKFYFIVCRFFLGMQKVGVLSTFTRPRDKEDEFSGDLVAEDASFPERLFGTAYIEQKVVLLNIIFDTHFRRSSTVKKPLNGSKPIRKQCQI